VLTSDDLHAVAMLTDHVHLVLWPAEEPRRLHLQEAGEPLASHRVEKWNDWAVSERCKGRGMSWTAEGVVSLAVLEAARRNGELEAWRRDRKLPRLKIPRPPRRAA